MKTCIKCNLDYGDEKKFCKNCGAPLSVKPQIDLAVKVKKQVLEEKLTNDTQNIVLLHEYLNFLVKHEINNEALIAALKILAINDSDETAQQTLFDLYPKLQMHQEAIEIGELIMNRKKNDVNTLETLLAFSSKINDEARKKKYTGLLLSLDNNNHNGLYQKGLMLLEKKQLEEASKIFERLASEGNDDRISVIYAAISKIMEENFQDGRQILDKALKSEDIQPKDMDNNRGFLYLTYCLCKQDEEIEEINRWFSRIEFQVLDQEHTEQDERIAAETIREIFRKVFSGEKINYTSVYKINLLVNQYLEKNLFYFTELTKDIIADIWLIIGEKQIKFKLRKDASKSINNAKEANSSDELVTQKQKLIRYQINSLGKKNRKKLLINLTILFIIILLGIASYFYLEHLKHEKAFDKANSEFTYNSFEKYLSQYPNGKYVDKVYELQEEACWEKACNENTYDAYQNYCFLFANGKYIDECITKQEEALWTEVITLNTLAGYHDYLNKFPNGKYIQVFDYSIENGKVKGIVKFVGKISEDTYQGIGIKIYETNNESYNGKYVGEIKDRKAHGYGSFLWLNGSKYEGEWKNDDYHGEGTYISNSGTQYRYVGEWKNGKAEGQGTQYWHNEKYIGEMKDGKRHGLGTYYYPDGGKWKGQWRNGEKFGERMNSFYY